MLLFNRVRRQPHKVGPFNYLQGLRRARPVWVALLQSLLALATLVAMSLCKVVLAMTVQAVACTCKRVPAVVTMVETSF